MILSLYHAATQLGGPLIRLYLDRRLKRGKEDPSRFEERLGKASQKRPDGNLVWLHGASVGESMAMLPLIKALREKSPSTHILVTTGTVTSARLMADRLPEGVLHHYMPVDRPKYVKRFLSHWRPDLALWMESEFWPNMIQAIKAGGIPLYLINGRVSQKSFKGWQRTPSAISELLSAFKGCLAQTPADGERLRKMGAKNVTVAGNLKFAADPLPVDTQALEALKQQIGRRPLWLAASTHPGEEEELAGIHRALRSQNFPRLLTIIVPRHPERGAGIAAVLNTMGVQAACRSLKEPVRRDTEVYIADTLGELGTFYALAQIVFMGKSLNPPGGGQNPIEPAKFSDTVLFGPQMDNFMDITTAMIDAGAAHQVRDGKALAQAVEHYLKDKDAARKMGRKAERFAAAEAKVLDIILDAVAADIPETASPPTKNREGRKRRARA